MTNTATELARDSRLAATRLVAALGGFSKNAAKLLSYGVENGTVRLRGGQFFTVTFTSRYGAIESFRPIAPEAR